MDEEQVKPRSSWLRVAKGQVCGIAFWALDSANDQRHLSLALCSALGMLSSSTEILGGAVAQSTDHKRVALYIQAQTASGCSTWLARVASAIACAPSDSDVYEVATTLPAEPETPIAVGDLVALGEFWVRTKEDQSVLLSREPAAAEQALLTPGMLSANFHRGLGNRRVVNLAQIASADALHQLAARPGFGQANGYWRDIARNEYHVYQVAAVLGELMQNQPSPQSDMEANKMTGSESAAFVRNENNAGLEDGPARAQAEGDAWFSQIARAAVAPAYRLPVEDRLDIIELTGLWDASYDALDRDFWLSCLTEDFVFASRGFGEFNGRAAMAEYFDTYRKVFHGLRHVLSNHVVVGESATVARGYCYLTVFERINGTAMVGTSPFLDRYVKRNGRWLFERRDQVVDPGMTHTPAGQKLMAGFAEVFSTQKR